VVLADAPAEEGADAGHGAACAIGARAKGAQPGRAGAGFGFMGEARGAKRGFPDGGTRIFRKTLDVWCADHFAMTGAGPSAMRNVKLSSA
jgi:hypothetical protein